MAYLLLLDADPRADISNVRRIAAVVAGGRYLARGELDAMMEKLGQRYAAMPASGPAAADKMHFEHE